MSNRRRITTLLRSSYLQSALSYTSTVFNFSYATFISILFFTFSYRRSNKLEPFGVALGVFYGASSFILNFPMAWLFSEKVYTCLKELQKKERGFVISFLLGGALTAGTTVVALQVAIESASSFRNVPVLYPLAIAASTFNTVSTRLVGSVYLLHSLWQWIKQWRYFWNREYNSCRLLCQHLEEYGQAAMSDILIGHRESDDTMQLLNTRIEVFYNSLNKRLTKKDYYASLAKKTIKKLMTCAIIVTLIANMMPLWIQLSTRGVTLINKDFAKSPTFSLFTSLSNELFYLNSGLHFMSTLSQFTYSLYLKFETTLGHQKKIYRRLNFLVTAIIFFSTWSYFSYYSGSGYAKDAADAVEQGFNSITKTLWFSWMGWLTTNLFIAPGLYDIAVSVCSGNIVNGGSLLSFLLRLNWFKTEECQPFYQETSEKIKDIIEKKGGMDTLRTSGILNTIKKGQQNLPYSSFSWPFFRRSPESEILTTDQILLQKPEKPVFIPTSC